MNGGDERFFLPSVPLSRHTREGEYPGFFVPLLVSDLLDTRLRGYGIIVVPEFHVHVPLNTIPSLE